MIERAAWRWPSHGDWWARAASLAPDAGLLIAATVIACTYLAMGVGNVMDDWFALYHGRVDGAVRAAGLDQMEARPVGAMVYAFVFGVLGRTVAPTILGMAVLNACSAMLVRRLVAVVEPEVATLVAALWLILPTVTSIEVWASASNISVALTLALGAVWVAARGVSSCAAAVAGVVLSAGAVLAYEAVVVLVVPAAAALLLLGRRRMSLPCLGVLAGAGLASLWVLTHWHPNKRVTAAWGDVGKVVPANLVWGIAPPRIGLLIGLAVLLLTGLAFSSFASARVRRARPLLAIGWMLLVIGVVPFLKYTYAPVGAGDRVNIVSSIGGALLIGTLLHVAFGARRWVLAAAAVAVVSLSLSPRVLLMRSWALAGDDADRIVEEVRRQATGGDLVVLGPTRVERNGVTAMQHPDIFENAVRYVLEDETARGAFPPAPDRFDDMDGVRIDVRVIIPDPHAPGEL